MSWTRISGSRTTSGTSTLGPVTVTTGNMVLLSSLAVASSAATLVVKDDLNNVLSLTKNSPFFAPNNTIAAGIAYYVVPTGGARTYTITWTGGGSSIYQSFLNEFPFTGSGVFFDKDGLADISGGTTPINLPVVQATLVGELLYAHVNPGSGVVGALSPWTAGGGVSAGDMEEFILSSNSGSTAVNYSDTANPDDWTCIAASFSDQPIPQGGQGFAATIQDEMVWFGGDDN